MQHDEMIWQVINHQFCSFKTTIGRSGPTSSLRNFCRHPYSATGLCNRQSCPLANSKYATIREDNGRVSLYIKTVERAHSPKNLWEKILLSRNYSKALAQVDEHLAFFSKNLIHRNKQRLTKIHQYLIRMRKIKLKQRAGTKAKLVGLHRKIDQREERREKKALVAAKIEANIEKELLERLARGTYGDIYNFPERPYRKALDQLNDQQLEEEEESESEEETESGMVEYVQDLDDEGESEQEEDMEDIQYTDSNSNQWGLGMESNRFDSDAADEDDESSDESSQDDYDNEDDDALSEEDDDDLKKTEKKKSVFKKEDSTKRQPKKRSGTRVEIEYEEEVEKEPSVEQTAAGLAW